MVNQNEKLAQNLDNLMQQFAKSRDNVFSYLKEKPKSDIFVTEDVAERLQKIQNDWKLDSKNNYNFAFVGYAKSGKSSLINALRGIDHEHPDAAPVCLTESTCQITTYTISDPEMKHIRFWDIPEPGVDDFQQDQSFCEFDCVFICCPELIASDQMKQAINFLDKNQRIAFVKSKCDKYLTNAFKMKEIEKIDQNAVVDILNEMNNYQNKHIEKSGISQLSNIPCFYVSAFSLHDLMNIEKPEAIFQEQAFIDSLKTQSMIARNISV